MTIAVDIPRKRIAVSRRLDSEGGTAVYTAIKAFLIEQAVAGFDWVFRYPWPLGVAIERHQVAPDTWTHTYIREMGGWEIESIWTLR